MMKGGGYICLDSEVAIVNLKAFGESIMDRDVCSIYSTSACCKCLSVHSVRMIFNFCGGRSV